MSPARKTEGGSEQTVLDSKAGSAHPPPWPMTLSSRLQRPRGRAGVLMCSGEGRTQAIYCAHRTHTYAFMHVLHAAHTYTRSVHISHTSTCHMPFSYTTPNMRGHNTHLPYATRMPHTTYTSHIRMLYDTHTHHARMYTHKSHRCCMAHTHQIHMCTHDTCHTHVTYTYMQHTPQTSHTYKHTPQATHTHTQTHVYIQTHHIHLPYVPHKTHTIPTTHTNGHMPHTRHTHAYT